MAFTTQLISENENDPDKAINISTENSTDDKTKTIEMKNDMDDMNEITDEKNIKKQSLIILINNENEFRQYIMSESISKLIVVYFNVRSGPESFAFDAKYASFAKMYSENVIFLSIPQEEEEANNGNSKWYGNYRKTKSLSSEYQFYQNGKFLSHLCVQKKHGRYLQEYIHKYLPNEILNESISEWQRSKLRRALCDESLCQYKARNQCKKCIFYFCDIHIAIDLEHCNDCYEALQRKRQRWKFFVLLCFIVIPFIVLLTMGLYQGEIKRFMIAYMIYMIIMIVIACRLYLRPRRATLRELFC